MPNQIGRVLYIVRTWVPEDQLKEWNEWHTTDHVPGVVEQPQVKRAHKYQVVEDNTSASWRPQYVTVYEFDSLDDWNSYDKGPEADRLRREYSERYGESGRISRQVLVEVVEVSPVDDAGEA